MSEEYCATLLALCTLLLTSEELGFKAQRWKFYSTVFAIFGEMRRHTATSTRFFCKLFLAKFSVPGPIWSVAAKFYIIRASRTFHHAKLATTVATEKSLGDLSCFPLPLILFYRGFSVSPIHFFAPSCHLSSRSASPGYSTRPHGKRKTSIVEQSSSLDESSELHEISLDISGDGADQRPRQVQKNQGADQTKTSAAAQPKTLQDMCPSPLPFLATSSEKFISQEKLSAVSRLVFICFSSH